MLTHFDRHPYRERKLAHVSYDYVFISPHLDDVVLSCSGAICALREQEERVLVLTLFAGDPQPPFSPLAQSFHHLWQAPDDAPYATRKAEERQAMALLGTDYAWLGWLEVLYRQPQISRAENICDPTVQVQYESLFATLCQWFADLVNAFPNAQFIVPLGVGTHRDHVLTRQAACSALAQRSSIFYEDFPYVAFQPHEVVPFARALGLVPFHLDISSFLETRIQATEQYQSQLDMLCHPPKRIEDVIRQYTEQCGGEKETFVERYWVQSPAQFPLSLREAAISRETDAAVPIRERQPVLPSFR